MIDYKPKRPAAIAAAADRMVRVTKAVFDQPVQRQRGDIFKVEAQGVCVEYTDKLKDAQAAFKDASLPKVMWKVSKETGVTCVQAQYI